MSGVDRVAAANRMTRPPKEPQMSPLSERRMTFKEYSQISIARERVTKGSDTLREEKNRFWTDALVSKSTGFSRKDAHKIFRAFDTNHDHSVTVTEFMSGLENINFFGNRSEERKYDLFGGLISAIASDDTENVTEEAFVDFFQGKTIKEIQSKAESSNKYGGGERFLATTIRNTTFTSKGGSFKTRREKDGDLKQMLRDTLKSTDDKDTHQWLDIRGTQPVIMTTLKEIYDLRSLTVAGVRNSGKMELESVGGRTIVRIVCHALTMKNLPFVTKKKNKRFLKEKLDLEANPPSILKQQLDMILIRDEGDSGGTLITLMLSPGREKVVSFPNHKKNNTRYKSSDYDGLHDVLNENCDLLRSTYASTTIPFLGWVLVEAVTDEIDYLHTSLREWMTKLDDEITKNPLPKHVQHLHYLQSILNKIKATLLPLVKDMQQFDDDKSELSQFFRDHLTSFRGTRDELRHVVDEVAEMIARRESLVTVFRQRTEERSMTILYVMTIVTTIFIPAQFLAGVYGMNFDTMYEMKVGYNWDHGYWFFWGLIALLTGATFLFMHYYGMFRIL
eukprot:m.140347 g.140347  ORF g.140347 m.140347 type:complete len:562 (+) comp14824_c0_seq1:250-1935(+)